MPASEINYPGPYEVRIFYTVNTLVHTQRLNVRVAGTPNPGDDMSTIDFLRQDDSTFGADGELDEWADLLAAVLNSGNSVVNYAELWKYEAGTFNAEFISTYDLNVTGASASAYNPAGQAIMTFRTTEGGIMKISIMESILGSGVPLAYSALSSGWQAIIDAVRYGTTGSWLARDTSYPFSFIRMYPGQNEALFKKRYRP